VFDSTLPNDEARLRALIAGLRQHGPALLVVDQPATIGALPVAVARDEGISVAYLPGLAMRRIADLHVGEAKTDARDAAIIADAARCMPHTLRSLKLADEQVAELTMLCGFDDDLVGQITQTTNRLRGLLTQIHPALERMIGPRLDHRIIQPCWIYSSAIHHPSVSPQLLKGNSPRDCSNWRRGWVRAWRARFSKPSVNRQ
jgi:transposase